VTGDELRTAAGIILVWVLGIAFGVWCWWEFGKWVAYMCSPVFC
jgi:hypothetical protein